MDPKLGYANETLGAGVQILATHEGEIKERLIAAFCDSLVAVPVDALPDEPKQIWQEVWATATASGKFTPSINALTEAKAVELAKKITHVAALVDAQKYVRSFGLLREYENEEQRFEAMKRDVLRDQQATQERQ